MGGLQGAPALHFIVRQREALAGCYVDVRGAVYLYGSRLGSSGLNFLLVLIFFIERQCISLFLGGGLPSGSMCFTACYTADACCSGALYCMRVDPRAQQLQADSSLLVCVCNLQIFLLNRSTVEHGHVASKSNMIVDIGIGTGL